MSTSGQGMVIARPSVAKGNPLRAPAKLSLDGHRTCAFHVRPGDTSGTSPRLDERPLPTASDRECDLPERTHQARAPPTPALGRAPGPPAEGGPRAELALGPGTWRAPCSRGHSRNRGSRIRGPAQPAKKIGEQDRSCQNPRNGDELDEDIPRKEREEHPDREVELGSLEVLGSDPAGDQEQGASTRRPLTRQVT